MNGELLNELLDITRYSAPHMTQQDYFTITYLCK